MHTLSGVRITGETPLNGGLINHVSLLTTEHDQPLIRKVFQDGRLSNHSHLRAHNERAAMIVFGGIGISPRLIASPSSNEIISQVICGKPLDDELRHNLRNGIHGQEAADDLFLQAGNLLASIHTTPNGETKPVSPEEKLRFMDSRVRHYIDCLNVNQIAPTISPKEIMEFWVREARPRYWQALNDFPDVHTHGDFWLNNLIGKWQPITGKYTINGTIDWELYASHGSVFEDFAIAKLWTWMEFTDSKRQFITGYSVSSGNRLSAAIHQEETIDAFLFTKLLDFLSTAQPRSLDSEGPDGFYRNKVLLLNKLMSQGLGKL